MGVYSGNRTLLGETYEADFAGHVLDLALEAEQNDLKMFEAVINVDFIQAYNEAGMLSLTEADAATAGEKSKDSIVKKIKELLKKIGNAITTAVKNFIAKIRNAVANDNKIIAKYKKYFTSNKDVMKTLKLPTSCRRIKEFDAEANMKSKNNEIYSRISAIDNAADADAIASILSALTKVDKENNSDTRVKAMSAGDFEEMLFDKKAEDEWSPTDADLSTIVGWMDGGNNAVKKCKEVEKSLIRNLDNAKKGFNLDKRLAGDDQLAVAKANAKYKAATKLGQILTKYCNMMCNGAARQLAMARKEYIILGSKCAKKVEGGAKATTENAIDEAYVLGEMSDSYMEAALLSA